MTCSPCADSPPGAKAPCHRYAPVPCPKRARNYKLLESWLECGSSMWRGGFRPQLAASHLGEGVQGVDPGVRAQRVQQRQRRAAGHRIAQARAAARPLRRGSSSHGGRRRQERDPCVVLPLQQYLLQRPDREAHRADPSVTVDIRLQVGASGCQSSDPVSVVQDDELPAPLGSCNMTGPVEATCASASASWANTLCVALGRVHADDPPGTFTPQAGLPAGESVRGLQGDAPHVLRADVQVGDQPEIDGHDAVVSSPRRLQDRHHVDGSGEALHHCEPTQRVW